MHPKRRFRNRATCNYGINDVDFENDLNLHGVVVVRLVFVVVVFVVIVVVVVVVVVVRI